MMKNEKLLIAIVWILCILISLGYAFASTPDSLTINGRLQNTSGTNQNGTFNMTFQISDTTGFSNVLFEENKTVIVNSGVFFTILYPTLTDDQYNQSLYLRINIAGEGFTGFYNITNNFYSQRAEKANLVTCQGVTGASSNLCTITDTNTQMGTDGIFLYNDSTKHYFNDTKNNATIDTRASVFNDTTRINNVNSSANIKGLGFNLTVELNSLYINIDDVNTTDFIWTGSLLDLNYTTLDGRFLKTIIFSDTNNTIDSRLNALESSNTSQDSRLDSLEASNTSMDSRMDNIESSNNTLTTNIGTRLLNSSLNSTDFIQGSLIGLNYTTLDLKYFLLSSFIDTNNTIDTRLDNLESSNTTMNTRVTNLESSNTSMNTRMNIMESSNTTQATAISNLMSSNTTQDTRLDNLEASNTTLTTNIETRLLNSSLNTTDIIQGNLVSLNYTTLNLKYLLISTFSDSNNTIDLRLDNLESSNTSMNTRITYLESSNTTLTTRIDNVNTTDNIAKLINNTKTWNITLSDDSNIPDNITIVTSYSVNTTAGMNILANNSKFCFGDKLAACIYWNGTAFKFE